MPPAAMTTNAIAATRIAPIMKRRVCFRTFSVSVIPLFLAKSGDQRNAIDRQDQRGDRVRGDDEVPPTCDDALGHAVTSTTGSGGRSFLSRSAAMRERSKMKPVISSRMPNAFARSGIQNGFDTVDGDDCC